MNTTIQLVNQAGNSLGYLDVQDGSQVPLNISIADIKDIQKRTGSFSKTITLPGTKNNNLLLNHYYDINILNGSTTFDVNKIQRCLLIQDGIPILDNTFLQLLNVKKEQSVNTEDDLIRYEVQIKDSIGDFFGKISGLQLTDLDLDEYDHLYTGSNIISSWGHTYVDGYIYPVPHAATPDYQLTDFKPAVYAKTYWEQIHARSGYSYDWSTESNANVLFDQLVITYSGEDKKVADEVAEANKVIAESNALQQVISVGQRIFAPTSVYGPGIRAHRIPDARTQIFFPVEIQDPNNEYNDLTSQWTCPNFISNPNAYDFTFNINYELKLINNSVGQVLGNTSTTPSKVITPFIEARNTSSFNGIGTVRASLPPVRLTPIVFPTGTTILSAGTQVITASSSFIQIGDVFNFNSGFIVDPNTFFVNFPNVSANFFPAVIIIMDIISIDVKIKLKADTLIFNSPVSLSRFVPRKFKQSDFIKTIMTMYNLFVEIDPINANKLIYKHRDDFYDSGQVVDWTYKLARDREQLVQFIPEISSKRIVLSYTADDDPFNKIYQDEIKEVYGQQEIIFQNEYVKGVSTKLIPFGPIPSMDTIWDSNLPLLEPKGKLPRILIHSGVKNWLGASSNRVLIENFPGNSVTYNGYPVLSHFNRPVNPTVDINFGICDFYFYDPGVTTQNNLYNQFWRRTLAQIDAGKLMTVYFALTPADIQLLRLNDKIRIDNSYWNINRVIDYNAAGNDLTKVELISIDEALRLLNVNNPSERILEGITPDTDSPIKPNGFIRSVGPALRENTTRQWSLTSTINTQLPTINYGQNNQLNTEFYGIVLGNNILASEPGLYIGDYFYDFNGNRYNTKGQIIDGGSDTVRPLDATNPVVIIDGGLNTILPIGTTKPILDGGLI